MANFLSVVVKDAEKAGLAIVHEIEALPSQIDHGVIDLFKISAKAFGSAAVQKAVQLAEQAGAQYFAGKAADLITDVEHTQAFEWVKGELIQELPKIGVPTTLVDAHALAGMALSWVAKGIGLVEGRIATDESAAGL